MGGLFFLFALSMVMALASFLAGALPLSMSLSPAQLRFISSLGIGILVGTSLIVIIPEGIEAVATATRLPPPGGGDHATRHFLAPRGTWAAAAAAAAAVTWGEPFAEFALRGGQLGGAAAAAAAAAGTEPALATPLVEAREDAKGAEDSKGAKAPPPPRPPSDLPPPDELPTLYIGFSLITGFALMFLIDRLPQHASEKLFNSTPTTRHISLDNLAAGPSSGVDEESESARRGGWRGGAGHDGDEGDVDGDYRGAEASFLGLLAPTPRQSRSLATTTGLVIHAAADGIALGAAAVGGGGSGGGGGPADAEHGYGAGTGGNRLGLVVFVAIMIHKAPAAFGLTSVLLKQGLSKRAARGHLVVFSLAAPLGALATYFLISLAAGGSGAEGSVEGMAGEGGQWWTGMLLLFSAGTFLYVAMHAMQEENATAHDFFHSSSMNGYGDNGGGMATRRPPRPQMRDTVATVAGMLLPLLTQFGHHH